MRWVVLALCGALLVGCSDSDPGPEQCVAAGGECKLGSAAHTRDCANVGPQDCNPDVNPGGAICCLPCAAGKVQTDAGSWACD